MPMIRNMIIEYPAREALVDGMFFIERRLTEKSGVHQFILRKLHCGMLMAYFIAELNQACQKEWKSIIDKLNSKE